MIVKFISNKKGGSTKSIDYLLNEREQEGTARVLQGDPQITRDIINNISRKQKVTMGVMSFEEPNIKEELKYKLMEELEKTMFPGMSKDEYNILWVEHTDKSRLELNFVVPKEHLPTQKALQPYYHNQDLPRFEKLQKIMNIEHSFTDPQDPSKKRTLEVNSKEVNLAKDYIELDNTLHSLIANGSIQNREQMIELLNDNNIQVTRQTATTLSIKLPDSKKAKRFKGDIYNEKFRSPEQLKEFSKEAEQRVREYNRRDTQTELRQLKQGLTEYNEVKATKIREQYKQESKSNQAEQMERVNISDNTKFNHRSNDRILSNSKEPTSNKQNSIAGEVQQASKKIQSSKQNNKDTKKMASTNSNADGNRAGGLHRNTDKSDNTTGTDNIHTVKEQVDDSTRNAIINRIRREREEQQQTYENARQSRVKIHKTIGERSKQLRDKYAEDSKRTRTTVTDIQEQHKQVVRESKNHIKAINKVEPTISRLTKFKQRVSDYIKDARNFIADKYNDLKQRYDKNFVFEQDDLEKTFSIQDTKKSLNREMSFKELEAVKTQFDKSATRDIQQEAKQQQEQKQQQQSRSQGMSL